MLIDCLAMRTLAVCIVFIQCFLCSNTTDYYDKGFCVGKPDGLQADPEDCRAYYDCISGRARHRTGLSVGLMFDPKTKEFRHSDVVNCTVKKVYHERWTGIFGANVADLESSPRFPCEPSQSKFIDTFCIYNTQLYDNYGQRLRSFFRAPETGDFRFQTSCDDACQLWLSDNEIPSRKQLIVHQREPTRSFSFDKRNDQSSKKMHLTKGKLYYMELLHKEDMSYDFMCVGVKFPTMKKERPVSSRHLVMGRTELNRIGCQTIDATVENAKCNAQACRSPQQKLQSFQSSMDNLTKELGLLPTGESPSSQQQLSQLTQESARTISEVLGDKKKYQWRQSNSSLAMQIAEVTETFGKELARKWSNKTSGVKSLELNIALQASVVTGSYVFLAPQANKNWQGINDSLSLKVIGKDPQSKTKVFSVIYKTLHEMLPSTVRKIVIKSGHEEGLYKLNSRVIGSLVTPQDAKRKLGVLVTLQHVEHRSNATFVPVCVWWDFNSRNINSSGMWSSLGCELDISGSNETHSVCKCNHLTNFAILMKVKSDTIELDEAHIAALEIITYVGCGLSLVGVTITVVIISCLSSLRSERNLIHLNLSVAIGFFQVIFLAGIEATTNKVACTLVAVLLHYFLLVSFAWMLVEGVYLYIMVITVFEKSKEQLRTYGACAYGLPGVIVLIAVIVARDGYGTKSSCWLSIENGVIYAFVAPALLIILINTVVLGMVIREIIKVQTNGVSYSTKLNLVKSGIKSVVVLFPLLGVTWLFGILALDRNTIAFQYLFAICNSLQGFFIFVFHCLLNSEIHKALQRKKEIWSSRRTTLFAPSSLPGSSAKGGQTSKGATVSDANMMSLSEDTHSGELIINRAQVLPSPTPEENPTTREQVDILPNEATNEHRAPPAWLERKASEGSAIVKLPPVSAPVNKKKTKKKAHGNKRGNSKEKLNAAIEPVKEEAMTSNVGT